MHLVRRKFFIVRSNLLGLAALWLILSACNSSDSQSNAGPTDSIRLNQLGFYPNAPKTGVALGDDLLDFEIRSVDQSEVVFKGILSQPVKSDFSDKRYQVADFSELTNEGRYVLVIPGAGQSYPFEIRRNVHQELAKAAIKNYYFQRMSIPLEERFAGTWARPAGHPDTRILVHESAASEARPAGTVLSAPKGWYDAGDYNKYVVNSGITMGTMLAAYEDFPAYYARLELNIPESGNDVPDLLDEILWNLRWLLAMQDPNDGGVYHKLTNQGFDGMVMPHEATKERYVVQKGTGAALNFAAVTAQAGRIFKGFEQQFPGLADSCVAASKRAWAWAISNPNVLYEQEQVNKQFDPDIVTGAYGDRDFDDEFAWAASELLITTRDNTFLDYLPVNEIAFQLPSWNQVRSLGYYSLLRFEDQLRETAPQHLSVIRTKLVAFADELAEGAQSRAFRTVMGKSVRDYIWGSSSVAANQGVVLVQAYRITDERRFLDLALSNLDYLLGRNATGYSFVTGFGSKTPMHPHHRPSEADGIQEPIPGMLSGGPNPSMQDKCDYPSDIAEEAFVDDVCSYASNEIAINWNAPLVYLSGAVEVLQTNAGY